MSQQTVTINGTVYDKHTGMPIRDQNYLAKQSRTKQRLDANHNSHAVHQGVHRSETLDRRYVKKTTPATSSNSDQVIVHHAKRPAVAATPSHPSITKFAPHPADINKKETSPKSIDIQPTVHPLMKKVQSNQSSRPQATAPKPSHILKKEAEKEALAKADNQSKRVRGKAPKAAKKQSRARQKLSLAAAGMALLLLGGYFTYINMPNLSIRVAAAQAGIDANYPTYRPSGYSLSGPIAYDNGQVKMTFAMNGGPQSFTLNQERSGWDSIAVLDSYVMPRAGENYTTSQDSGLTIYTFDNHAAWVNRGILYTIEGDAPLSAEQVRHIATSI